MHHEHRQAHQPAEQREWMQQIEERAGIDRTLQIIEMKRDTEEQVPEGDSE